MRLKRILDGEGSDTATIEMLGAFGSLRQFDRLWPRPFVVARWVESLADEVLLG